MINLAAGKREETKIRTPLFQAKNSTNQQWNTPPLSHLFSAIRLQPEGREKFYWSGEQFVITCQNNNNIKNGECLQAKLTFVPLSRKTIARSLAFLLFRQSNEWRNILLNSTTELN